MKTLYTHRIYTLSGEPRETVLDLSKVAAISRVDNQTTIHLVGVRAPLVVYNMPDVPKVADAAEYAESVERGYNALVAAWKAAA